MKDAIIKVKKMFEAVGLQVDKLSRTRFGNLDLTGLRPWGISKLNKKDISKLHTLAVTKTVKNNGRALHRLGSALSNIHFSPFPILSLSMTCSNT